MSHFTCMVFGEELERQLAPFHEFETTGLDDEHVIDVDDTEKWRSRWTEKGQRESFRKFLKEETERCEVPKGFDRENPDPLDRHLVEPSRFGYTVIHSSEVASVVIRTCARTNPNARWDWYSVGGRWAGMLLTRAGSRVDQARVGDVDFPGMEARAAIKAEAAHSKAQKIVAGREWITWEQARGACDSAEKARELYWGHPVVSDLSKEFGPRSDIDHFQQPKDEYVERARLQAGVPFAYVAGGRWYEKGKMGWWATVADELDPVEWARQYRSHLKSVDPDTTITVVDCHI